MLLWLMHSENHIHLFFERTIKLQLEHVAKNTSNTNTIRHINHHRLSTSITVISYEAAGPREMLLFWKKMCQLP
jgi:hypothetical protein